MVVEDKVEGNETDPLLPVLILSVVVKSNLSFLKNYVNNVLFFFTYS